MIWAGLDVAVAKATGLVSSARVGATEAGLSQPVSNRRMASKMQNIRMGRIFMTLFS
jgi:hypothetical protein